MNQVQKESVPEEMNEIKKFCSDCKTSKTPLWRCGPSGPKSLCNACGIRYRKKRSVTVGLNKGIEKKKEKSTTSSLTIAAATTSRDASSIAAAKNPNGGGDGDGGSGKGVNLCEGLRVRLVALGKEVVMLQRQRSPIKRQRSVKRKLGEEEQAVVLLMSLSCGSVFA